MNTQGNMKNRFMWVVSVLVMFVLIIAEQIWGIRAASAAAKPTTLRMAMSGEPDYAMGPTGAFHPGNLLAEPVVINVMEPLVDYVKGIPVPKLATKWEHSEDLTKWRFYLRKGVKFHNGASFTASDVVEYVNWNIELKNLSRPLNRVPIKKAVAVDEYTVDLTFEKPQPLLLINMRYFLIYPVAISRDNREMHNTLPVGTGPYRMVERKLGHYIKLTKFEGYWGPKPQIDNVEITFRPEAGVRMAALKAGEVDWIYGLDSDSASRAPKVVRVPSSETVWIRFDEVLQKNPIFVDKRIRLGVEYAIDRKALVALYGGFATPSLGQFASPGEFGFNPDAKSRPYDLEKAKSLVKEAGAVGKTVTMVCASDRWSKSREVAEAVAYMIEQTGLKVKLLLMPETEAVKYKKILDPNPPLCDIYLGPTDALFEVETRYLLFVKGGPNCTINDQEANRQYNKEVLPETDYAKRGKKLAQSWAYVYEQSHYVPLFKLEWMWGIAKNLQWDVDMGGRAFFSDMRFTD